MTLNKIAIIGLGCSGTALAINLLKSSKAYDITIFEPSNNIHRGLAYSTNNIQHLLNVPACKMSILFDQPKHFVDWLSKNYQSYSDWSFVPRKIYGEYLKSSFDEAIKNSSSNLKIIPKKAISLEKLNSGFSITDDSNSEYQCDKLVITTGWHNPAKEVKEKIYNLHNIPEKLGGQKALIIGTGLTAVDSILSLRTAGFNGEITLLSRRGMLATVHKLEDSIDNYEYEQVPLKVLLKNIRNKIKLRELKGLSWHGVIDALRPYNQLIWSNFTLKEKQSFLRHLRPYWDVHRHRMSSEIFNILNKEIESKKITLLAGRLTNLNSELDKLKVEIKLRNSNNKTVKEFDFAVDATGMQIIKSSNLDNFYKSLFQNNLASLDALKIGIRINLKNQLLDSTNNIVDNIYGLGPIGLGSLWETIAVPEISKMAYALKNTLNNN